MKTTGLLLTAILLLVGCSGETIPADATLEEAAQILADGAILQDVYGVEITEQLVKVEIEMASDWDSYDVDMSEKNVKNIICALHTDGRFGDRRMMIVSIVDLVGGDRGDGLVVTLEASAITLLPCDDAVALLAVDVEDVAGQYVLRSGLE